MLTELMSASETALLWERASDMAVYANNSAYPHLNALQGFKDERIQGVLEFCRMIARTIIIMTALLAVAFWSCGSYILLSSGGDERRLERGREVFRRVFIGVTLAVSSYLLVSTAVNIYVGATGLNEIITFWDDDVFDGGVVYTDLLPHNYEIAFEGEVLLIDKGDKPIVCKRGVETIEAAIVEGWNYRDDVTEGRGNVEVAGCYRTNR